MRFSTQIQTVVLTGWYRKNLRTEDFGRRSPRFVLPRTAATRDPSITAALSQLETKPPGTGMSQEIKLRLASVSDAFQIAVISRDLIETGLGWSWTPPRVIRNIRCPDTTVLVADARSRVAGFAIMYFGDEEAHLNLLAVRKDYRRAGIGRRLIEWLEMSALVAGVSVVYLEVRANNRGAQTFYEKLGYRKIAHVPRYYAGRESAVYMARDLLWSTSTRAA